MKSAHIVKLALALCREALDGIVLEVAKGGVKHDGHLEGDVELV